MIIAHLPMMTRAGEFAPASYNAADNTIEMVWTTGAKVRRANYTFEGVKSFDEELIVSGNAVRLGRLNAGAPLLDTHGQWSLSDVIGSVVPGTARLENGVGLAKVKLSQAADDAAIVQKIRDGVIRNISAGYRIHAVEKIEKEGQVPLVRVIDWEPFELSAVPVGADAGAQIRAAADLPVYPCEVRNRASAPALFARRMQMRQRQSLA